MPFIPENQPETKTSSPFKASSFVADAEQYKTPMGSLTEGGVGSLPVFKQATQYASGLGSEIGKAGLGLGQVFLKGSQYLGNKLVGTSPTQYNPLIQEMENIKQNVYTKPFESETQSFAGKIGQFTGMAAPFVATGGAVTAGQQFLKGATSGLFQKAPKAIPYLIEKFAQVAPEVAVTYGTELARTGGNKESAKTASIGAGIFSGLSHVGADAFRQLIPQDLKTNALRSLGMTGKVNLKDIAVGKKLDDTVGAYTTISRLAPDIEVTDANGIIKKFDPTKADFIELPQAHYKAKNMIYEAYSKVASDAGDAGAKFKAGDFFKVIDDLKKYDGAGYTPAYSNKANQIIESLQRFVKTGERGQKYFADADLTDIQRLIENINTDVNPLSDKAGAKVALEASQKLRGILDDKIANTTGAQYQQLRDAYAQLKSIEPAVINAFKKATRGSNLSDFIDGVSVVDALEGIITQNPTQLVRGGLIKGTKEALLYMRSPERDMRQAFKIINQGGEKVGSEIGERLAGPISTETGAFKAGQEVQGQVADYIKNPKLGLSIDDVTKDMSAYKGEKDLTTKILKDLEGKTTVSKQYILDATNRGELKQVERDLIRDMVKNEGDTINVSDFAKKVKAELLPLKRKVSTESSKNLSDEFGVSENVSRYFGEQPRYENISLPDNLKGEVADYSEYIYESPIKTSAGDTHFSGSTKNYFGHTRIEDMADNQTRRVIEVQSDLYQKGNLEQELPHKIDYSYLDASKIKQKPNNGLYYVEDKSGTPVKFAETREQLIKDLSGEFDKKELKRITEVKKLQQYNDPTAHFRMVREEIKKAAQDGKTKLQFPTGETAMKIEGLGETQNWISKSGGNSPLKPDTLKVGEWVRDRNGNTDWIITDVLGDGKFKAVEKRLLDNAQIGEGARSIGKNKTEALKALAKHAETFDISGKVDTSNPIYKFYEKDVQKYLTKFGGKRIVDDKGVSWFEVPISKEQGKLPVEAFGIVGLMGLGATQKK